MTRRGQGRAWRSREERSEGRIDGRGSLSVHSGRGGKSPGHRTQNDTISCFFSEFRLHGDSGGGQEFKNGPFFSFTVIQSHGGPLRTLPHKNLFFATTNVFASQMQPADFSSQKQTHAGGNLQLRSYTHHRILNKKSAFLRKRRNVSNTS